MPAKEVSNNLITIVRIGRKIFYKLFQPKTNFGVSHEYAEFTRQAASDLIMEKLSADAPVMICRLGSGEIQVMLNEMNLNIPVLKRCLRYLKGEINSLGEPDQRFVTVPELIFPKNIQKFTELMLEDMKSIDVLGSWLKEEIFFRKELSHALKVRLPDLEPYYHQDPWSEILRGKKVLVIHPFEESIQNQYKKREFLFKDKRILPEFELITIKSVFETDDRPSEFKDWFEALESMKKRINATDFDIAIIGCGSYGLPLAAHVKRMGKKAVHLGGATQVLFGIRGKRWESNEVVKSFFNEHWTKPLPSERPKNYLSMEGGCYW